MSRRRRRPRPAPWLPPVGPGFLPLTLPPLAPLETAHIADLLEQLSDALWHAYGDGLEAVVAGRRRPAASGASPSRTASPSISVLGNTGLALGCLVEGGGKPTRPGIAARSTL